MERALSGRDEFCEWQERLKRFETSGLSIDAFCRQEEIGRATFMEWLQTLRKDPTTKSRIRRKTRPMMAPIWGNVSAIGMFIFLLRLV